jgi:hypothetical protein
MSDRGRQCRVQHTTHDAHRTLTGMTAPRRLHVIHAHQHTDGNGNRNVQFEGVKEHTP